MNEEQAHQEQEVDKPGPGEVVTIASEGMEPLETNGTNEIVSPDSPKRGDLVVLSTKVAEDGETVDIQRDHVEQGDKREGEDQSEVSDAQPKPEELKQDPDIKEEQPPIAAASTEVEHAPPPQDGKESVAEDSEPVHKKSVGPAMEVSAWAAQKAVEEHLVAAENPKEEAAPLADTSEVNGTSLESVEKKVDESAKPGVEKSDPPTPVAKPKFLRTMTLPVGTKLSLPWQKKRAADDVDAEKQKKAKVAKPAPSGASTSSSTTANPLSGMMKSIKKGLKIRGKSHEDAAPGRIQQRSGARPSPRIVSSLSMSPTHEEGASQQSQQAELETPASRRRKILDEITDDILSAMPPSPTHSDDGQKEGQGSVAGIYANIPESELNGKTPEEDEICPSVAAKPGVDNALAAVLREKKANDMMASLTTSTDGTDRRRSSGPKPPRPPPAKNGSSTSPTSTPLRNLPPPPRPAAPPKQLQKSYTLAAGAGIRTSLSSAQDSDVITPTTATSPVHAAPPMSAADYAARTASLGRRRLYRTKEENRAAKRTATLSRPVTMHETTFTLKPKRGVQLSFDETASRPTSSGGQKIVYERKEAITLPKLPSFGSKKNKNVVARPQLSYSTSSDGHQRSSALKSYMSPSFEENCISATASNVQCSAPGTAPGVQTSIGIQTAPLRPKAPITSIRHGTSPISNSPPTNFATGDLKLPYTSERLVEKLGANPADQSPAAAIEQIHSAWLHTGGGAEKGAASHELVTKCLQEYMTACVHLRSADLQGEFAAFHWQYGDIGEAGWFKHGSPLGWPTLDIFHDSTRQVDFVQLPIVNKSAGSIVYPERTIDSMLASWIDIGRTQGPATPQHPTSGVKETTFHPASVILRLSDLLSDASHLPATLHTALNLAILLSVDYCSSCLPQAGEEGRKLMLDLNTSEILLLCSPANSLVLFRVVEGEEKEESSVSSLLKGLFPDATPDSVAAAATSCIEKLSQVPTTDLEITTMLQAIAPPDWIMQAVARISLGRGVTPPPAQPAN